MARSFDGASGSITTGLTAHGTLRTYALWVYRVSDGEGAGGRMFDKRASGGAQVEVLSIGSFLAGSYLYTRAWSGGTGAWGFAYPATNAWRHLGVTYDAGAAANDPLMYLDGVSQAVSESAPPSGAPSTNADAYMIGNRSEGDRTWDGRIAEFAVWDVILTAAEMAALGAGISPLLIRPASLVSYVPLLGGQSPEPDWKIAGGATVIGTAAAAHPRVFKARGLQTVPLVVVPVPAPAAVARGVGVFDVSWASYVQGLFRLGVSQLGSTDTLAVSPSADRFTGQFDAIEHVLEFSYERGRTDDYTQVAAGTGSVLVRDPDGRFNEANPASPLFGLIEDRLHPARLSMTLGGVAYSLFYGFTRRIKFTPTKRGGICSFELVDLFYWLQRDKPVIALTGWTTTGAVIGKILDAVGWVDPAGRLLDQGDDILSYEATGEKTALQLIEELLEVERGLFFIDGRGRARFVSRHSLLLSASQAAIVNQMRAVSPGVDFDRVRNYAEVAREGSGVVKTAFDQPSINRVGRSEWSAITSAVLRDENQAQGLADYLVLLAKSARPSLHSLQIDNRTEYLLGQVLGRELGEVVTVSEAETGTTGNYRLEHLRVGYTQKTGSITASYLCSARPTPTPPFRIGISQIGGADVLVY